MEEDAEFLRAAPSRRIAMHYLVHIPVGLQLSDRIVDGSIVDISDSGARIECDPLRVSPGKNVQMDLRCFRFDERITMLGKVVRETPAGCALRFVDADSFLRVFVKLARLHDETVGDRLEKILPES